MSGQKRVMIRPGPPRLCRIGIGGTSLPLSYNYGRPTTPTVSDEELRRFRTRQRGHGGLGRGQIVGRRKQNLQAANAG
jgi:hypothetical protein